MKTNAGSKRGLAAPTEPDLFLPALTPFSCVPGAPQEACLASNRRDTVGSAPRPPGALPPTKARLPQPLDTFKAQQTLGSNVKVVALEVWPEGDARWVTAPAPLSAKAPLAPPPPFGGRPLEPICLRPRPSGRARADGQGSGGGEPPPYQDSIVCMKPIQTPIPPAIRAAMLMALGRKSSETAPARRTKPPATAIRRPSEESICDQRNTPPGRAPPVGVGDLSAARLAHAERRVAVHEAIEVAVET
jgi:hypothetical protein